MQIPSKFPHFCLWCHFLLTCQSRNHGNITSHTESYTKAISLFLWKSSWILSLIFQCHWLHPGPCSLLSSCLDYSGKLLLFSLILSPSFSQDSSKLSAFISQGHSWESRFLGWVDGCQRHHSKSSKHQFEGHQMRKMIYQNSSQKEDPLSLERSLW